MRRVRYQVACSLDGYIAGPNGEYDWIVMDPDIDFKALFDQFDTLIMGRETYNIVQQDPAPYAGLKIVVFSRTLRQQDHPGVTIVADNIQQSVDSLRAEGGKDIWLFGGGKLFRSLLEAGCVDTIEPAIIPVVLGAGIPMVPTPSIRAHLKLCSHRLYPKSGIMLLEYSIVKEVSKEK